MTDKVKWRVQLKTFVDINEKEFCVSTVDLGGNLHPSAGFETMVFRSHDHEIIFELGEINEFTRRYKTQDGAIVGHYLAIDKLIEKLI